MKKVVIIGTFVMFCLISFLVVSVLAVNSNYLSCSVVRLNCEKAKVVLNSEQTDKAKKFKDFYEGVTVSKEKIVNMISELKKENYDVKELEYKFNILDSKVDNLKKDYLDYLDKLKKLGDNSCDEKGLLITQQEYESQLEKLHLDTEDIKSYSQEVGIEFDKIAKDIDTKKKINI